MVETKVEGGIFIYQTSNNISFNTIQMCLLPLFSLMTGSLLKQMRQYSKIVKNNDVISVILKMLILLIFHLLNGNIRHFQHKFHCC
jgi:hypothetical protein